MATWTAGGWMLTCLAAAAVWAGDYDPARDSLVNPPSLVETPPREPDRIAADDWIVRHLRAEPATLNPILTASGHELTVQELLFDEPVVLGPELEWTLNPAMAEAYSEADDHLTAELRLKPGLRWQDGAALTAEDVVFAWEMIRNEHVPAVRARAAIDGVADCQVVNALTVRFRFRDALPTNRWRIKFPILPRHVYERGLSEDPTLSRSDAHVQANRRPVGNGPYRLVDWAAGDRIVLERWADYAGPRPHFARVIFRIVPDGNTALLMFKRGELDEMLLTPQQFARDTRDDRFARVGVKGWADQATVYCIAWNMDGTNPFFGDVRVRQAMSHALNMPLMLNTVYDGLFSRSRGLFPPGSWAYNADIPLFDYDPRKAATLLDAAGWQVDPEDGWRYRNVVGPDGTPTRVKFAFTLGFAQESKTSPQLAAVFQQDLRRLGVDMKLQALEYLTLRGRVFTREFQAVIWAWTAEPEPDDAWNLLHSAARSGGQNFVGYANPDVDALFEQGRRSFDPQVRRGIYQALAARVYEDAPYTFLINAPSLWAFHKRIRGVHFSPMGPAGFYPGARAWWVPAGEGLRGKP